MRHDWSAGSCLGVRCQRCGREAQDQLQLMYEQCPYGEEPPLLREPDPHDTEELLRASIVALRPYLQIRYTADPSTTKTLPGERVEAVCQLVPASLLIALFKAAEAHLGPIA